MLEVNGLLKAYVDGASSRLARMGRRGDGAGEASVLAVNGVDFEVQEGELFTLLGPSGCGKTTTLRMVAGLERPDAGTLHLKDTALFDERQGINVPANRRGFGMVFQSYAVWPHMSVYRNTAFPFEAMPRRARPSTADIRERVDKVLEFTGLHAYADRSATKLSGGQQQRLALARALVTEPPLLLLDEPLSNLDAKLRESMRFELKRVQRELGITTIYVTHDQGEALVLSNRIAVMRDGQVLQTGRPREIYEDPTHQFVAEFVGTSNFIQGVVGSRLDDCTKIETSEGELWTSNDKDLSPGSDALVSLRPENLAMSEHNSGGGTRNEWRGDVVSRAFLGDSADHIVSVGKLELRIRSNPSLSIPPGTPVCLSIKPKDVTIVPPEGSNDGS